MEKILGIFMEILPSHFLQPERMNPNFKVRDKLMAEEKSKVLFFNGEERKKKWPECPFVDQKASSTEAECMYVCVLG